MEAINFKVDHRKCTACKKCVSECPVLIINGKTEYPEIKEGKEDNCIKCQHCLAVCPEGAISIWGKNPEDSVSINVPLPDSSELGNLMKLRRSVRRFKKEEINRELINQLSLEALYAPTAHNGNSVLFSIIDNREDMNEFRDLAYKQIIKKNIEGNLPENFAYVANFAKLWEDKKIDVIFRNAPHLIIASAPGSELLHEVDGSIALTYFDLLANSKGIGTLWDGFAKFLIEDIAPELKEKIGIPTDHKVIMVLLFGVPLVKYARSVQNDNTELNKIQF